MSFEEQEDRDGVRLSWHNVPKSKLQSQHNIVPLAAFYTPFNNKSPVIRLPVSHFQSCRQCKAILNPFVSIHSNQPEVWRCQFCGFGNRLLVAEDGSYSHGIQPESTTVEYFTGKTASLPPIFFYCIDTCFEYEDVADAFAQLKESILLSLSYLPSNTLVGFVTFGKHVQLHDLSVSNRSYTFNGAKDYELKNIETILGLNVGMGVQRNRAQLSSAAQRFLQPIEIAEYQLSTIIDRLPNNTFPRPHPNYRPERAVGCALKISSLVLQAILGKGCATGGHLMCFIGGVATYGPGKIVGTPLKEPIRSHHDIDKSSHTQLPNLSNGVAKVDLSLYKRAKIFYETIARMLVDMGISCDIFIGSYDQVGLSEMDEVAAATGGVVVMSDSFSTGIFKQSLIRFLRPEANNEDDDADNEMALNATLECRVTSDFQIQGLIGHATSLPLKKDNTALNSSVSPLSIGQGNTNSWKLCGVNHQSTYAIYFDKLDSPRPGNASIQLIFHYESLSGEKRVRVTTIPLGVIPDTDHTNLEAGFDQEAGFMAIARSSVDKLQTQVFNSTKTAYDHTDVAKHLDKIVVDFCARFGVYRKKQLDSFCLSHKFSFLPQFVYHLRRSPFIRVFNNSPDETSYIRHVLMHEDLINSLIMIQPTLYSYDIEKFGAEDPETGEINGDPEVVPLDSMSLGHTKILLLDTFFHILIYHGSTVAQWRKANYHNMEGYEHFREFLEAPKEEALEILKDRFPLPRFIDCDDGGSQARFLMAKLNPSTSYSSNPNHMYGGQFDVMTDDTSLQSYITQIQRLAVTK
ncbi:hypothetical protein CJJ07_003612 [Candidozyma auris]|nr:hypothetical protein CJJ07_003612 [[Candida] auris]QEL62564.1 hypothetical protein CJJ09_004743 [[Candida] auris]